jgi:hypothetical protein
VNDGCTSTTELDGEGKRYILHATLLLGTTTEDVS